MGAAPTVRGAMLLAGLLGGACTTAGYNATRIDPLPPGIEGKVSGTGASFDVEGLAVMLYGSDTVREDEPPRPLDLHLVFHPRELGYSFDPGQVLLRDAAGTEWRPRVHGPGLVPSGGGPCQVIGVAPANTAESTYRFLSERTCFDLAFDLTVQPDVPLALVLDGFARGPRRLAPLTLRIQRRSWRSIEHIWPLEILLLPLMVS